MVATFLQDDLVAELKKIFLSFRLKNPKGELTGINVFPQAIPIPVPQTPPEKEMPLELAEEGIIDPENQADPYPYIIVRMEDGKIEEIDGAQTISVLLIIGVFDDALNNQGHKDVLNIIHDIYARFSVNPILAAKYECVMPMNWALQEEESYPYFIGGVTLNFETIPIRREDKFA